MTPDPWPFALLALAAYRVWKLIGDDAILDRPRAWAVAKLGPRFDEMIGCPYCLGAWIAFAWWLIWLLLPTAALIVATPFALSAIVGLIGVRDEPA